MPLHKGTFTVWEWAGLGKRLHTCAVVILPGAVPSASGALHRLSTQAHIFQTSTHFFTLVCQTGSLFRKWSAGFLCRKSWTGITGACMYLELDTKQACVCVRTKSLQHSQNNVCLSETLTNTIQRHTNVIEEEHSVYHLPGWQGKVIVDWTAWNFTSNVCKEGSIVSVIWPPKSARPTSNAMCKCIDFFFSQNWEIAESSVVFAQKG